MFTFWVWKLPFSKGFFHMFILGSCYCTLIGCSPKWKIAVTAILLVAPQNEQRSPTWTIAVPALQLVAPQNERSLIWTFEEKKPLENGNFCTKTWTKLVKKNLWLDRYDGKGFWAKKMAQLVIPVRSTFQNDLHPPIRGPHPVPYFTTQTTKKYCTAMC